MISKIYAVPCGNDVQSNSYFKSLLSSRFVIEADNNLFDACETPEEVREILMDNLRNDVQEKFVSAYYVYCRDPFGLENCTDEELEKFKSGNSDIPNFYNVSIKFAPIIIKGHIARCYGTYIAFHQKANIADLDLSTAFYGEE